MQIDFCRGHDHHKKIWVKWDIICKSKLEGALGVLELKFFSKVLLEKWKWRLQTKENSLWKEIWNQNMDLGEYWTNVLIDQTNLIGEKILEKCAMKAWKECGLMQILSKYLDWKEGYCFGRIDGWVRVF